MKIRFRIFDLQYKKYNKEHFIIVKNINTNKKTYFQLGQNNEERDFIKDKEKNGMKILLLFNTLVKKAAMAKERNFECFCSHFDFDFNEDMNKEEFAYCCSCLKKIEKIYEIDDICDIFNMLFTITDEEKENLSTLTEDIECLKQ